jgi:uncharacterized UBP type Zn finger protein
MSYFDIPHIGLTPGRRNLCGLPELNQAVLTQLEAMGTVTLVRCRKAFPATGNNGSEAATKWHFVHREFSVCPL